MADVGMTNGELNPVFVGFDNGTTGTYGVVDYAGKAIAFGETPVKTVRDYTLKIRHITRIDVLAVMRLLHIFAGLGSKLVVVTERPLLNPRLFRGSVSAVRAYEALLIAIELAGGTVARTVDIRNWMAEYTPLSEVQDTKENSARIGVELFPQFADEIAGHGDADGLLMAEYARREYIRSGDGSLHSLPGRDINRKRKRKKSTARSRAANKNTKSGDQK